MTTFPITPAYEGIWGKSLSEVYADPDAYLDGIHVDDFPEAKAAHDRQLARDETEVEFRVIRPDGSVRWVRKHAVPVCDANGRVERIVGTMRDITERREVEDRLAEQAALLDAAHEAIFVKDMEDRIIYWNKGAERIYGWTTEEALGQFSMELLGQVAEEFSQARKELLKQGEWSGELVTRTKDGRSLTVEAHWTLVRDDLGNHKSILAINSDITKQTLEVFGYQVLLAENGADAVALYARHQAEVAVVLTDMMMPVMDGPTTIKALRKMNPAVRIIGASGITANGKVAQAVGAGVKHFLPKPYTAETLLKVLAQVLERTV